MVTKFYIQYNFNYIIIYIRKGEKKIITVVVSE